MHISFGKSGLGGGDGSEKKSRSSGTGSGGPILLKKPPKVAVTPSGTINTVAGQEKEGEDEQVRLNMENINLQEDHKSVASSASDEAHAVNDGDLDDDDEDDDDNNNDENNNDDEDEWDEFQQA